MPFHCVVVAREVWDTRDLLAGVVGEGGLNESALSRRFEPEDLNSLEQALQLKDAHGGKVTVLSVGPPREVDVLRECLYRGVDEVIRILPPEGLAPDTAAQAELLAAALRRIGEYDLVLAGVSQPEGENSLLGAHLASLLELDQVTYVDAIEEIGDPAAGALCKREVEMGSEYVRVPLPAVLVMGVYLLKDDPRTPRSAKAMLKLKMKKARGAGNRRPGRFAPDRGVRLRARGTERSRHGGRGPRGRGRPAEHAPGYPVRLPNA